MTLNDAPAGFSHGLEEIKLRGVLPAVFSSEREAHGASQVWLQPEVVFRRGETALVVSESGRGKSSLCAYLFGLRTDYEGSILMNGRDIRGFSERVWTWLRRNALAYLPQEMRLFPELTVVENLRLKLELTRFKPLEEVLPMLEALGIAEHAHRPAGKLSIGQQQRAALVRALCQPFDFLLLDEPVSHLDGQANAALAALVAAECDARGAGLVATSVGNHLKIDFDRQLLL